MNRRHFLRNGIWVSSAMAFPAIVRAAVLPSARRIATPTPQAAGFTYYATRFDGTNDYMSTTTMSGSSNSKIFLMSFWVKKQEDGRQQRVLQTQSTGDILVYFGADNKLNCIARNSAATQLINVVTGSTITGTAWHHVIISADTANSSNRAFYIDGATATPTWTTYTNDTIQPDFATSYVGASHTGADKLNAELCELWIAVPTGGTYFDITNSTQLQKFRSAGGLPVDLGATGSTPTGSAPNIYLKNPYSSFEVNATGNGNFTVTGALTAGTPP